MIELARPKSGEKMVDLGSGDGRILVAFAKSGVISTGFELDEELVQKSQEIIIQEKLESKISVQQKDFWSEDLGNFDIITIYPMPDIMQKLLKKLQNQTKKGARVLLNYYPLPTIKPDVHQHHVFLYQNLNATEPKLHL